MVPKSTFGVNLRRGLSQKDWDRGAEAMALFSWTVGIRPHDTVYYCIPFGVWVGAWGYLHGIDKIGARQCTAGFVPSERHIVKRLHG